MPVWYKRTVAYRLEEQKCNWPVKTDIQFKISFYNLFKKCDLLTFFSEIKLHLFSFKKILM